jgi:hypothetical protein
LTERVGGKKFYKAENMGITKTKEGLRIRNNNLIQIKLFQYLLIFIAIVLEIGFFYNLSLLPKT